MTNRRTEPKQSNKPNHERKRSQAKNRSQKKQKKSSPLNRHKPRYLWDDPKTWLEQLKKNLAPLFGYSSMQRQSIEKTLLIEAFTHRTFAHEQKATSNSKLVKDNQRLEFLGDSILGYLVTTQIYSIYPKLSEGELTSLRATLINRTSLRDIAIEAGLEHYLRLGRGEPNMGEAAREARLADLTEAVIGALYLDLGLDGVSAWLWPFIQKNLEPRLAEKQLASSDPKTDLQHWAHKHHETTPTYETTMQESLGEREYYAVAKLGERKLGYGQGKTKREAQRKAAQVALKAISNN